ncbi:MAG TPA: acyl-CoA dehydratase activase [Methylomusa anaerophila]|uniref:R-phenyllactate dehydratase activator n=1 Tax=Methylomusa anaerophila TaxID=1930071 RepID=A0A348AG22_9FIRM|nr:acyl-CoA dehydratase activase [Methylomusa anaerophila]BBB90020.1 R-phenyllactate dehydratase activator [Methylomusa anaerophila]HML88251.1 acyl-CoA dehydratase activase [Methylomusa anaerophila]
MSQGSKEKPGNNEIFAGVDVGSLTAKAVIIKGNKIIGRSLIQSGIHTEESGKEALQQALQNAGLSEADLTYTVATGYGRISAPYANKKVTEIMCHATGAYFLDPRVRTIVDMGGQDCKAIRLNDDGKLIDFTLNDKCAAGTGRFLEVMARVFQVPLEELGPLSLKATHKVAMSSTCTVFAESEVISLRARGELPENIISGIHHAIAQRIAGMFSRVGVEDLFFFSGGVSKNIGQRKAIEEALGVTLVIHPDSQLVGAIGAAIIGQKEVVGKCA